MIDLNLATAPSTGSRAGLPRLQTLARHGRNAESRARSQGMTDWSDDLSHLGAGKLASWKRILSAIATTEAIEQTLMEPLLAVKASFPETLDYLESHSADERRHHDLLKAYLKNTFGFEKTRRTLADRVIYDRLFPGLARVFRVRPLFGFALLHAYERFSLTFYGPVRREAQADGAQNLLNLIQSIEKDELRHVAGMEQCLRAEIEAQGGLRWGDLAAVRAILGAMLVDVDMRAWAVHNREVRGHLANLGVDTDELTRNARDSARATLGLMKEMGREARA